ncbi:hypothetical protein [Aquimarina brevivitae]|uniref:Uncharacterized protein n=1 Tax=Aquimarina brevivitae TaxID=323412 RepID=A0A4Q7P5D8_9FLAO|nr:hypothetical protein [Aquimarina brevivitae]RZS93932.1 hypothetical protein EV197_2513 [Aquimarina brevivitae]
MTYEEIRIEFEKFVGNEKYNHFILSLYDTFPLKKRLLFWQESLLKDFFNKYDLETIEYEQIYRIFNRCPVHHYKLKHDTVTIIDGNEVNSTISYRKEKNLFPMANIYAPRDLNRFSYPKKVNVVFCSRCRKVYEEYH